MSRNIDILSVLDRRPLPTYQDFQAKQLAIENQRRMSIGQDLINQKAQQEQRDHETMAQVFSSNIPSEQIGAALRQAGLPGHALEWENHLIAQQKALLDMGKERRDK